jgi:hypothetical protein
MAAEARMGEHKHKLSKTDRAKILMAALQKLEFAVCGEGKLSQLEFATALRVYLDDIMKVQFPAQNVVKEEPKAARNSLLEL